MRDIRKKKVLLVDLNSGVWPHTLQSIKVLGQLESRDVEVVHVACGSAVVGFCPVRQSRKRSRSSLLFRKNVDCRACKFSANLVGKKIGEMGLRDGYQKKTVFIERQLTDSSETEVERAIKFIIENSYPLDYKFLDAPVVRMALFEWVLKFKKRELFPETEEEALCLYELLDTALRFSVAGQDWVSKNLDVDFAVCHSPQYVANNAFTYQLGLAGKKTYFVSGADNLSEMESSVMIWDWQKQGLTRPDLEAWGRKASITTSAKDRQRVEAHMRQLSDGRSPFVYSSSGRIDRSLPLKYNHVVGLPFRVLMTLSSLDEMVAIHTLGQVKDIRYPGSVFQDQQTWVQETIDWFRERPDAGLIIRIHPRELPNRRDSITSQQSKTWDEMFSELPKNVVLNHPFERLPLEALLVCSEGLVTGWSSTALQALVWGKPVVSYDSQTLSFPGDTHLSSRTRQEYFSNLEALIGGKALGDRDTTLAWLEHSLARGSVQLTGRLFHSMRISGPRWVPKLLNGLDRYLYWIWRPLELSFTLRKTEDGKRIRQVLLGGKISLYDSDH